MRVLIFVYWFALAAVAVLLLAGFTLLGVFVLEPMGYHIYPGLGAGASLAITAALSPLIKKLCGMDALERRKQKKFSSKYPILSEVFPIDEMKSGDEVVLDGYGVGLFDGKFLKKYVVIVSTKDDNGDHPIELTKEDLIAKCSELRNDRGVKWQRYK